MIKTAYTVSCDVCQCEAKHGGDTPLDAVKEAQQLEFEFYRVPNGSIWSVCPKCHIFRHEDWMDNPFSAKEVVAEAIMQAKL